MSPILSNLYLHELDKFMEKKIRENEEARKPNETPTKTNPAYAKISGKIASRIRKLKEMRLEPEGKGQLITELQKECRKLIKERRRMRSTRHNPKYGIVIKYERYADDWIVGIRGRKRDAVLLKKEISDLLNHLKLKLSEEKTLITHFQVDWIRFLGAEIRKTGSHIPSPKLSPKMRGPKKRVGGGLISMRIPEKSLIKKLIANGFMKKEIDGKWDAISLSVLIPLPIRDIIQRYKGVLTGYLNYYSFADNKKRVLKKIH